ncbi:AI-2E family transporter [Deinococcus sp. KNUC1210]|uniref:AI-2E family transporter n=1 Tax=Deinococcus sp. KNUC1210 TaxID=2917691 RepID=UPI001EF03804|nr:AI-2E family transporter [Deinococcus sp. KNUC1210]ULH14560.1 AI-2E family transporter [Deinococcus sp. KNUC1210]
MLSQPPQNPSGHQNSSSPHSRDNAFQAVWRNPYVRVPIFLLLIYLTYRFFGLVSHVFVLALIAYIVAYLAHPLLNWLVRHRVPRGLGVLVVVLLILSMVGLASTLLVTIVTQFYDLVQKLPGLTANFLTWFDTLARKYTALRSVDVQLQALTENGAQTLQKYLLPYLQKYQSALVGGIFGIASSIAEGFATLILAIYMMLDYDKIGLTLIRMFPRPWQPFVLDLSSNVSRAVGGYLKGQLVIAAFVGVFVGVGLALSGIPSAPAIGFLAGLFNIVPYLGVVIAITPALLLAATTKAVVLKLILVVVVFVAANQIEGHLLSPLVLGRTTDLHPVTVVLAILSGLALFGIVGALVAVPITALAKLLLQEYYYPSRVYTDGP